MDTVEGIKGHSLLLTLCILPYNFLLAYKIEEQTISEITEKIKKQSLDLTQMRSRNKKPNIRKVRISLEKKDAH